MTQQTQLARGARSLGHFPVGAGVGLTHAPVRGRRNAGGRASMSLVLLLASTCLWLIAGCIPVTNDSLPNDPMLSDDDGDGYPDQLADGTVQDCDDSNQNVSPDANELCDGIDNNCNGETDEGFDFDDDGFLDLTQCSLVSGNDCNDRDRTVNVDAREVCDSKDNNCNGKTDEGFDQDGDGYASCSSGECDDGDAGVNEGEKEICDGQDNDCDGKSDEGFVDPNGTSSCVDDDGDAYTEDDGDCDDKNKSINPKAKEVCDQKDNDCDEQVDEGYDEDNDAFKTCENDCDDTNADVFPGADELCDDLDNDCNGEIDEIFVDSDGDGYRSGCGDCDDTNSEVRPNASEICDGLDNDCNQVVDDGFDLDSDGVAPCVGDCDDTNPNVNTQVAEVCDLVDNNCDTRIDEGFDVDGDSYSQCATSPDCNDNNPAVYPGSPEVCDGQDNNCDGASDEGYDADGDGFGDCQGQDCDDTDPSVKPNQTESCNQIDDDCDGKTDEDFDLDLDGYSLCSVQEDCNDSDATINPGVQEVCGDGFDNNCNDLTDESVDQDNDGWTTCGSNGIFDCDDFDKTTYPQAVEQCNNKDNNCSGGDGDFYVSTLEGDYASIQGAINAVPTTCTIVVAPGTYRELIDFKGKAVWLRSETGPNETIIESTGAAGAVVTFQTSEKTTSILEGFTIQNGLGLSVILTSPPRTGYLGGGIYVSSASPTIRNNVIYSNNATWGGGLYAIFSSLVLEGNTFAGNSATEYGSAFFLDTMQNGTVSNNIIEDNTTPVGVSKGQATVQTQDCMNSVITNNTVQNNYAYLVGGIALLGGSNLLVDGNVFDGNSTAYGGAAIGIGLEDASDVSNNYFNNNRASLGGGAIYCYGSTSASSYSTITYNTFTANDGTVNGGAIQLMDNCQFVISNNLFVGNKAMTSSALGGAILISNSAPRIANNIFVDNQAVKGGAVASKGTVSTNAIIENNTFYNNASSITGSAIYLTDATPLIINNLLTFSPNGPLLFAESTNFNLADIRYNDLYGSPTLTNIANLMTSNNNASFDPKFISASGHDFHLGSGSAAIDGGDGGSAYFDPDGTRNDMGAYGGPLGEW